MAAKKIERIPFAEYKPILATVSELLDPKNPTLRTLVLSEELQADKQWGWLHGQQVNYWPLSNSLLVDLQVMVPDFVAGGGAFRKDLPEGEIPNVHEAVWWIATRMHPYIDFTGVNFADVRSGILTVLQDHKSFETVDKKAKKTLVPTMYSAIKPGNKQRWFGYVESTESDRRLKADIAAKLLTGRGGNDMLAKLDPSQQFLQGAGGLSDEEWTKVENLTWPPPPMDDLKPMDSDGVMVDIPDSEIEKFLASIKPGTQPLNIGNYCYIYPLPDSFKSVGDMAQQLIDHIQLPVTVKYLRRIWISSRGYQSSAEYSISYDNGRKGGKRMTPYALEDFTGMMDGFAPRVLLKPGSEAPKGYVAEGPEKVPTMYDGPGWFVDLELEGKALPGIMFTTEEEFCEHLLDPCPALKEGYLPGKGLVYIANDTQCERNFVAGHRGDSDYHNPAVNNRSVWEWIIGPMAHWFAYSKATVFKCLDIHQAVSLDTITSAFDNFQKEIGETKKAEKNLSKEALDMLAELRGSK